MITRRLNVAPQLGKRRQTQLTNELLRSHPNSLGEGWICQLQLSHLLDSHAACHTSSYHLNDFDRVFSDDMCPENVTVTAFDNQFTEALWMIYLLQGAASHHSALPQLHNHTVAWLVLRSSRHRHIPGQ